MRVTPIFALLLLMPGACASPPAPRTVAQPSLPTALAAPAAHGLAFAQARCAACHAVVAGRASPNPDAPAFEAVVNTPGLTAATLTPWLQDSHNFPAMMNFAIAPGQIADLAAYMLTLRRDDYRPPIQ